MTSTDTTLIAESVRALVAGLDDVALDDALGTYAVIEGIVDAARSRRLVLAMAAAEEAGQDPHKVAKSAVSRGGKGSRRTAEASVQRARVIGANEGLGDRLDSGELTPGQVDNIACAMDTDESAATDQELIDRIAERSVDQGRRVANDWATAKASAKVLRDKHRKQRHSRTANKYWSVDRDAMALTLYGDGPTIDQLWRHIAAQERIEYQNDGGRDISILDHQRTRDQRRFDAAVALLMGTATPAGGRPAAVISIPWATISGTDPDACAEQIGYGSIPETVALEALMTSDLFVNLTGLKGQTLWWGRTRRHADRNQFIALVLRDKGCVLCGNDWQNTESHHLMPWEAPGKGQTNIEELALVCSACHHHLHDNHLTLYQDHASQQWLTRPAKPDEIAPKRPNSQQKRNRTRKRRHRAPATSTD